MDESTREKPTPPAVPPSTSSLVRPVLALLAGLGVTAVVAGPGIVMATLAMLRGVDPRSFRPSTANLLVYLAINAAGAVAGGATTAIVSAGRSYYSVLLLAVVLFMSALVPALRGADPSQARPEWYAAAQAVVVLAGVLLGALLARRRPARRA